MVDSTDDSPNTVIPITLPLLGLNTVNPFVDFISGYAKELTNNSLFNGRVYMRHASRVNVYNNVLDHIGWFDKSAGDYGIENITGTIINLATSVTGTVLGQFQAAATTVEHLSLKLMIGCKEPRLQAYPFTGWTITTSTITATDIKSACSYKGRLYVADDDTLEFTNPNQITGAIDAINFYPLATYLGGQKILRIFQVTINPSVTTDNVFVIFADGGRVLVYQGDDPLSTTWNLTAQFDMPIPVSNIGFTQIDGDIFVATRKYAYWFRDLFSGGAQTAYDNSPTQPIENIWQASIWEVVVGFDYLSGEYPHSFYIPELDAIVTQCMDTPNLGSIANYNNTAAYFVYFRKYKAWAVWLMTQFFNPVREISGTTYGTGRFAEIKELQAGIARDTSSAVIILIIMLLMDSTLRAQLLLLIPVIMVMLKRMD